MKQFIWNTSRRHLVITRPIVMGILNVTPDSFSDGGKYSAVDSAIIHAEHMIQDGADIVDVGGESTRPGSKRVSMEEEISRTIPVIQEIAKRFDIPISVDTSRLETASAALNAGAEIINDISGLRFDERIADVSARSGAGLILMHSRGTFESMHSQEVVLDIVSDVIADFQRAVETARSAGVNDNHIVLDIGLGFGKAVEQNLELIAKLDKIIDKFSPFPMLVGASRKSFIGKILGGVEPSERLGGSIAIAIESAKRGAAILRVHDVKATVDALKMMEAVDSIA